MTAFLKPRNIFWPGQRPGAYPAAIAALAWFAAPDSTQLSPPTYRQDIEAGYFLAPTVPAGWYTEPDSQKPAQPRQCVEPGFFTYPAEYPLPFGNWQPAPDQQRAPSQQREIEPSFVTVPATVALPSYVQSQPVPDPGFHASRPPGVEPGFYTYPPALTQTPAQLGWAAQADGPERPVLTFRQNLEPSFFVPYAVVPGQLGWYAHPDKERPPTPRQGFEPSPVLGYPPALTPTSAVTFGYSTQPDKIASPNVRETVEPGFFTYQITLPQPPWGWGAHPDEIRPQTGRQGFEPSIVAVQPAALPATPSGWYAYPDQQRPAQLRWQSIEPGFHLQRTYPYDMGVLYAGYCSNPEEQRPPKTYRQEIQPGFFAVSVAAPLLFPAWDWQTLLIQRACAGPRQQSIEPSPSPFFGPSGFIPHPEVKIPYTYTTFVNALQTEAVQLPTDPNWQTILVTIIDDAEQRIYRELDLINTIVRDTSGSLTANSRNFTLPQLLGRFVTVKGLNLFTTPGAGRTQIRPMSLHALDFLYPSETAATTPSYPEYFAPVTDQTFILGPAPDSAYGIEVIGTIRPNPLSATNPSTFLSLYLSDLFFAGAMVSAAGYMKNFGSQSDDPRQAVSWEQQYQFRIASASREELRRKYASGDWNSESVPPPQASPAPR